MSDTRLALSRRPRLHLLLWTIVVATVAASLTVVTVRATTGLDITANQRIIVDRLESVLLHDIVVPQYDRVVNQFDGRGYTAGIGDFSTAEGQVLEIVQTYTARVGPNLVSRAYLPTLQRLASDASDDVDDLLGFPDAWRQINADATFRQVQDQVLQSRYFNPARAVADKLGLTSPLGLAIIYDSLIQHGNTTHPDGLPAIINRANASAEGKPGIVAERDWLKSFLDVREAVLADPDEPAHQETWPASIGRVQALANLLSENRDNLSPPIEVNPYGTRHLLDLRSDEQAAPAPPSSSPAPHARPSATPTAPTTRPADPAPMIRTTPASTFRSPPPAPAPAVATNPRPDIVVRLVSAVSGKSVGVSGESTANGAPIIQSGNAAGSAQHWLLVPSRSACFHLVNVGSRRALDNPDGTNVDGMQMQQYSYFWENDNQAWCFQAVGSGFYSIRNLASGSLLDVRDGGMSDGTAIQQWSADPANPNINQAWRLILAS